MAEFVAFLDKWQDLAGAVVGGVIGGLVTFLGLWWTFRHQLKNDYPKKLIQVQQIAFDLREYNAILGSYIHCLMNNLKKDDLISPLHIPDLQQKLLLKAADTDKDTYRIVVKAFERFSDQHYNRIFVFPEKNRNKMIDKAKSFNKDVKALQTEIKKRIEYYEKNI